MGYKEKIKSGVEVGPIHMMVVADNGIGKTTLGASFPKPIIIDLEKGASRIDAPRYTPDSFDELVNDMLAMASDDDVGTVVIDTVDELERLGRAHVRARESWTPAEFDSYGRGPKVLVDEMVLFFQAVETLLKAGKHVVYNAHAELKREKDPSADQEMDRWNPRATPKFANLFREKADMVFFMEREKSTFKDSSGKQRAVVSEKVVMHTKPNARAYTKTRDDVPPVLEIPAQGGFAVIKAAVDTAHHVPTEEEVNAAIAKYPEAEREPIRSYLASQKNWARAAREVIKGVPS